MISLCLAKSSGKLPSGNLNELMQRMSPGETQQIMRYRRWQDMQLCLFGKLLFRESLILRGLNPNEVCMKKTYYGKPFIEDGPYFNISHSGDYAICAMSEFPVGIDIEKIADIEINDFANQWHDNELMVLQSAPSLLHSFYQLWTKKESVIKADGRGLSIALPTIDVSSDTVKMDSMQWYLHEIKVDEQYACHIAHAERIFTTDVQILSF